MRSGVEARRLLIAGGIAALVLGGRSVLGQTGGPFGNALAGLLPGEFERFRVGLNDFLEVESVEEGLGPSFNATSCAACHNVPAVGGVSLVSEVRAAHRDADGTIRPLTGSDGKPLDTLFHLFSNPTHGCQPILPPDANVIARRIPIPTFGAGLVEAIADETLLALEDPDDRDGDGISGRAAPIIDRGTGERRIGRFGWKAQHATLRSFSADAYRSEMGITNELFPDELVPGVSADALRLCDPIPDPEAVVDPRTHFSAIDNFEAFLRFLAPPPRGGIDGRVAAGEQTFKAIGCALCHVPVLMTAPSRQPLFDRKPVALFSDLLLHDIGTGDGIPQASATPEEIRTPALWGLRVRRPYLHDGSASTVEEATARHRGEAEQVRGRFDALDAVGRVNLIAFLNSL